MSFKGEWQRLEDIDLYELTLLAKNVYPNFNDIPEKVIRETFEVYKKTTLIFIQRTEIKGFVVYQEWNNFYNVFMIYLPFSKERNLKILLDGRHILNSKPIKWFDENIMGERGVSELK